MRSKQKKEKKTLNILKKFVVVALFVVCVCAVINLAPNYIQDKLANKTNVIVNNNNITRSLKKDVIVDENEIIYISFSDIKNFFDENIYYDKQYNQIITGSNTKIASLEIDKKQIYINSSKVNIYSPVIEKDDTYYLPISEMENVYNVDVKYSKDSKIVTIDSLDREQKTGNSANNADVKYKPTVFSKTIDNVKKGENVVVIDQQDGWYKIRTSKGNIGYIKDVANIYTSREKIEKKSQIEGKVSMVWDYYTRTAPTRTERIKGINVVSPSFASVVRLGKGEIATRIGSEGQAYITWAHNNGYKVWPMISNDSLKDTTSEILNDYKLREKLINNIMNIVLTYNVDGINIDFENIKEADKDMYTRFIIELAPRLAEYEKVLSVDVTAPDGSPDWSLCFDRNKLAKVADYLVFMAYDQYGDSSDQAGTTAGADWIETNLKKFVGKQEEVDPNKLILGMPFFTRLWKETSYSLTSTPVYIKSVNTTLPNGVERKWNENLKQYVVEYQANGTTYKMWIEDDKSLGEKFELMHQYKLAGAAYWQKDFESSSTWDLVDEQINK